MNATTRCSSRRRHWPVVCGWIAAAAAWAGEADAQSGRIVYQRTVTVDVELPGEMIRIPDMLRARDGTVFSMFFTPSFSLMVPENAGRGDGMGWIVFPFTATTNNALRTLLTEWHGREENVMQQAFSNADGQVTVRLIHSIRRTLVVMEDAGEDNPIEWEVADEHREHLGFDVVRATAGSGDDLIEAWFAPEIPVSGGPALYGGLPGMILSLSVAGGRTRYDATEIDLGGVDEGVIVSPDEGDAISEDEYRSIFEREVRRMRQNSRQLLSRFSGPPQPQCSIRTERSRLVVQCFQRR